MIDIWVELPSLFRVNTIFVQLHFNMAHICPSINANNMLILFKCINKCIFIISKYVLISVNLNEMLRAALSQHGI